VPMPMLCSVLLVPAIWVSMWFTSTCTRHAAHRTVVAVPVLVPSVSKNILSRSCQVHCQQRETPAILGGLLDHNLSARFVLIRATSVCWYAPTPTSALTDQMVYGMSQRA